MKTLTLPIVVLCLAGVAVASLVLREHYNTDPAPCDINAVWDCGAVNHTPYAEWHHVPVAMIGIMGYALLAALAGRFPWTTALAAFAGTLFSLRLTWIEWKTIRIWCVYCVTSQGIIVAILALAFTAALLSRHKPHPQ